MILNCRWREFSKKTNCKKSQQAAQLPVLQFQEAKTNLFLIMHWKYKERLWKQAGLANIWRIVLSSQAKHAHWSIWKKIYIRLQRTHVRFMGWLTSILSHQSANKKTSPIISYAEWWIVKRFMIFSPPKWALTETNDFQGSEHNVVLQPVHHWFNVLLACY